MGTIRAEVAPLVVLTSNRTREVHDALKRRCLYHWVAHPDFAREVEIVRRHLPEVSEQLARDVATAVRRMREMGLLKPPGVAETVDWAQALLIIGATRLDDDAAAATLGAAVKYHEDQLRVQREVMPELATLLVPMTLLAPMTHCYADMTHAPPLTTAVDLVLAMTGFAHALRDAGVAADRVRLTTSLHALAHVDVMDAEAVYWAARLSLCSEPDDLPRFDALFDLWFRGRIPAMPGPTPPAGPELGRPAADQHGRGGR